MATDTVATSTAASNTDEPTTTSRRGLLGIIAAAPVALLPFMPSVAAPSTAAWAGLLKAYRAARSATDAFDRAMYEPAWKEFERLAPAPANSFEIVARNGQASTFRFDPKQPDVWLNHDGPQFREHAKRLQREWAEHPAKVRAASQATNIDAIIEKSDALGDVQWEAEQRLIKTPAPDGAALAEKILISFDEGRDANWALDHILADARRLAAREA